MVSDDSNSDSGFASLMEKEGEVKALKREQKAGDLPVQKTRLQLDREKQAQRKAALGETQSHIDTLRALQPEKFDPSDVIEFKTGGLQDGVYKKLRTGRYEVEAKLDLHGFTVEQALRETLNFISRNVENDKRCVLISHGKGIKREQPARLKNFLAVWLKHMPEVLAFHSALPKQGGAGSVYVLLKKSEASKQKNRERFNQVPKGQR